MVESIHKDHFIQQWRDDINNSLKGYHYKLLKDLPSFESYLLLPVYFSRPIMSFRISNYHLPVETGRWKNIPSIDSICKLRNSPEITEEFNYLFKCSFFENVRTQYIPIRYC